MSAKVEALCNLQQRQIVVLFQSYLIIIIMLNKDVILFFGGTIKLHRGIHFYYLLCQLSHCATIDFGLSAAVADSLFYH